MVSFEDLKEIGKKWAEEYCKALNETPEYEEAAKGWGVDFEGAMLFIMEPSGEVTFEVRSFLDLKDGKCLGIKLLEPGEAPPRPPGMTLRASMLLWKKLAFKEMNPIQALMSGELKLEGDMGLAMRYSQAAMLLADVTEKTDRSLFTKFDLGE
ncbi:MAG: SCP2 sterol-binding domain-containing protein [Candidatus Helarchaeota archaeon]